MFYKDFQTKRKELGLTIEQISLKIKISEENLKNLENGEFNELPDLYFRLFIKAYAQELGLDPEEYLKKYEEHTGSKKHDVLQNIQEPTDEKEPVKINSPLSQMSDRGKLITFIVTFIVLIFVIVILKQVLSENEAQTISSVHQRIIDQDTIQTLTNNVDTEASTDEQEQNTKEKQPEETPVVTPAETETEVQTESNAIDSSLLLTLNIEIRDTCWVKMVMDEKDTTEALYSPGATREWKASEIFDLRIGRPEVVKVFLNGTQLDSVDYGVAPARLVITKDGITNR